MSVFRDFQVWIGGAGPFEATMDVPTQRVESIVPEPFEIEIPLRLVENEHSPEEIVGMRQLDSLIELATTIWGIASARGDEFTIYRARRLYDRALTDRLFTYGFGATP